MSCKLVSNNLSCLFKVFLPVVFCGVQSVTAHAADDEMRKQIAEFYNRVAGVFGFEVNCQTSK